MSEYAYGEPRVDLTPLDLFCAGYTIRQHVNGVSWCWWCKNPYDTKSNMYGAPRETVAEACADARRLVSSRKDVTAQPMLFSQEAL